MANYNASDKGKKKQKGSSKPKKAKQTQAKKGQVKVDKPLMNKNKDSFPYVSSNILRTIPLNSPIFKAKKDKHEKNALLENNNENKISIDRKKISDEVKYKLKFIPLFSEKEKKENFNKSSTEPVNANSPIQKETIVHNCPDTPMAESVYGEELEEHCSYAVNHLMIVKVRLGNARNLAALVDSGASVSSVNANLIDIIGGKWCDSSAQLIGLGGTCGLATKTSYQTEIFVENIKTNPLTLFTMPVLPYSLYQVLLGSDFFTANNVTIDPKSQTLNISVNNDKGNSCNFSIFVSEKNEFGYFDLDSSPKYNCNLPCYAASQQNINSN